MRCFAVVSLLAIRVRQFFSADADVLIFGRAAMYCARRLSSIIQSVPMLLCYHVNLSSSDHPPMILRRATIALWQSGLKSNKAQPSPESCSGHRAFYFSLSSDSGYEKSTSRFDAFRILQ